MARDLNIKGTAGIVDTDKYVYRQERDLSKTKVDWSEVASTLTKTIETVRDDRETRKAEIEENTRTAMNDFAKFDQYDSKTLNVSVQEGSQWSMNYLATQNDLMQRGLISPGEYKIVQQRMQDSWTSLKASLGNADAHFKEAEKRSNAGESTMFEGAINKSLAGFANLKQYELQGNPITGELGFVKKGADINDPESWLSMGVINQRMNQKSNYVDPIAEAKTITETLGEVVTIKPGTNQSFESYEDWKQMEGSQEYIDAFVGAMTATEDKKLSILMGMGYDDDDFTEDPEEAANDPSKILMRESSDGSAQMEVVLSEEQEKAINERAEGILKSQLDEKESFTKGFDPTRKSALDYGKNRDKIAGYMGNANRLQTSNDEEFELVSRDIITDVNAQAKEGDNRIENIDRNADEFIVTIVDSRGRTREERIPRKKDGKNLSMQDVAQGLIRYIAPSSQIGDQSFDAMVDIYNEVSGGFTGDVSDESASAGVGFQEVPTISYRPEETEVFTALGDKQDIDAVSIAAGDLLNSKLRRLGIQGSISIDPDMFGGDGEITINVPGVGEETIEYDGENANVLQLVKDYVEKARIIHNAKGGVKKEGGELD